MKTYNMVFNGVMTTIDMLPCPELIKQEKCFLLVTGEDNYTLIIMSNDSASPIKPYWTAERYLMTRPTVGECMQYIHKLLPLHIESMLVVTSEKIRDHENHPYHVLSFSDETILYELTELVLVL